jgi:hypothetical protein
VFDKPDDVAVAEKAQKAVLTWYHERFTLLMVLASQQDALIGYNYVEQALRRREKHESATGKNVAFSCNHFQAV